jgi:non-specific protein-tyrosine kinase
VTSKSSETGTVTISLRDVLDFLLRGAFVALTVAVAAAAAAFVLSRNATPVYRAGATLLASQPSSSYSSLGIVSPPPVDPSVYRSAVLDGPILSEALRASQSGPITQAAIEQLREQVRVIVEDQRISSLIRIEVDDPSPERAATLANTLAEALLSWDRERARQNFASSVMALEQAVAAIDAQMATLGDNPDQLAVLSALRERRLRELDAARALSNTAVVVGLLEPFKAALVPERPLSSRTTLNTALAFLLGLSFSYGFMLLRTSLDTRVRSSEELAALTGLPVIAEFPRAPRNPYQLSHEAASYLRTNLLLTTANVQPKIFLITSAQHLKEKTGVAVSLAESFARSRYRTLLVDADLRHPSSSQAFNLNPIEYTPLEVYLENPHQRYLPISVRVDGKRSFDLIPSFSAARSPVDLLNQGLREHLEVWRNSYDAIIIDSTPLLPFADTLAIAPLCTGVIVSTSVKYSSQQQVRAAVELLRRVGVDILGVVVTNLPLSRQGSLHYGYGTSDADKASSNPYKTFVAPTKAPSNPVNK